MSILRSLIDRMLLLLIGRLDMTKVLISLAVSAMFVVGGSAFAQTGPVGSQCASDIQTYCAGKGHSSGQTRTCLEANRDKVSAECRQALDATGPGRGKGKVR